METFFVRLLREIEWMNVWKEQYKRCERVLWIKQVKRSRMLRRIVQYWIYRTDCKLRKAGSVSSVVIPERSPNSRKRRSQRLNGTGQKSGICYFWRKFAWEKYNGEHPEQGTLLLFFFSFAFKRNNSTYKCQGKNVRNFPTSSEWT